MDSIPTGHSPEAGATDRNDSAGQLQGQVNEALSLAAHSTFMSAHEQLKATQMAQLTAASEKEKASSTVALKQGASEALSSLSAGVVGTVALSVGAAVLTHNYARAATIPLALAAGAVTKYGVKDLAEHAMLDQKDRTLSSKDLLWGGVDALAGIGASAVEGQVANRIMTNVGRKVLGQEVGATTAFDAGKMLVKESVSWGFTSNASRGIAGGVTGAAIWSAPHRLAENWQSIKSNPGAGLSATAEGIGKDIALGGAFGGALGVVGTAVGRHQEIWGKTRALVAPEKNALSLDTFHINDFHSNTEQLPRLKTILDAKMAISEARGAQPRFAVPGDIESGRVNFAFTEGGAYENRALMEMGAREITPGNHPYDAPGGRFDVPRYPAMMEPLLKEHPEVSLISANLDVSAYDQYQRILKPYAVREVTAPWGPTKVATIGLTTDEGAVGNIKWHDPLATTLSTIDKLKKEGVSVFQIHSHLGLGEDIKLAQGLIDNNVNVAGIIGAHSHDVLPTPMWVGNKIPIVQAGHSGKWLGEFNQVIGQDGAALRYQTTSRLHQVGPDIPENQAMRTWLDANLGAITDLKTETYNSHAVKPYSVAGSRNRETEIGNLYADAVLSGLQKRLGADGPDIALVHSGGIRSGLPAGKELSRLDLANIVMNAGNREGEKTELAMMNLTGAQLKDALEYGVRERVAEPSPGLAAQVKSLFTHQREQLVDEPGNFVQVSSGVKYTYDASRAPLTTAGGGDRIVDLQIRNAAGQFEPIDPNRTYKVAARFHPLDKWTKFKMFGDKTIDQVQEELNVQPLRYSQVDLIGEYITGKVLDPAVTGKLEGRITDLTPQAHGPTLRPGKSLFVAPLMNGDETMEKSEKNQSE